MENQTGRKRSNVFEQIMVEIFVYEGIIQHFSVRNTTRQKGVIEHTNQTLLQKVWIVLSNVGLGKQFWVEFVTYACHLINHLPSATNDGTNPLEKWSRKPPMDYGSLDVFGCIAYYHVKESKFMGITNGAKGYHLWCPEDKKILFRRDVGFDESNTLKSRRS